MPCVCFDELLAGESAVTLLVIDTEGFDYKVLSQYPFGQLATHRVVFEAVHLKRWEFDAAATLLHRHGFVHLSGGYWGNSVWHHRDAP